MSLATLLATHGGSLNDQFLTQQRAHPASVHGTLIGQRLKMMVTMGTGTSAGTLKEMTGV